MNEDTVLIEREEYEQLLESRIQLNLLLTALFKNATLSYNHKELEFHDIDDVIPVLFPEMTDRKKEELKGNDDNAD